MQRRVALQFLLALPLCMNLRAFADESGAKICLVYYTRSLNTHILASFFAKNLQIPFYRLETAKPYPKDYKQMVAQAYREKEANFCPELKSLPDLSKYDAIMLGTPLWSLDISSPIRSFLTQSDLSAKILIPFVANAGWGFGNALRSIKKLAPHSKIINALEYEFKLKEKTTPNLKALNERQIARNLAFEGLRKNELLKWLEKI